MSRNYLLPEVSVPGDSLLQQNNSRYCMSLWHGCHRSRFHSFNSLCSPSSYWGTMISFENSILTSKHVLKYIYFLNISSLTVNSVLSQMLSSLEMHKMCSETWILKALLKLTVCCIKETTCQLWSSRIHLFNLESRCLWWQDTFAVCDAPVFSQ